MIYMCICINLLDTGRAKLRYLSVLKSSFGSDVPFCDLLQDTWATFCGRFSICWPKKLSLSDICNGLCVASERGDRKET